MPTSHRLPTPPPVGPLVVSRPPATRLRSSVLGSALAASILLSSGFAQTTGAISGKVISAQTNSSLASAQVSIDGKPVNVLTDTDGTFRISNLAPGTYTLTVAYTDLDTQSTTVTVTAGETQSVDVALKSNTYELDMFVVQAEREGQAYAVNEQRQSDVMKNVVASDAFGNLIDTNAGELLKNLPGVFVDYSGEDASGFSIRGISSDDGAFTLDGNSVANSTTNPETSYGRGVALKNFSVASIETVEVFKVPPPSSPANANGGVVNMVTKNAFDQKGRRIIFTANLNLNSESLKFDATPGGSREPDRKWGPGYNVYYSEAFFDQRLGVSLNINGSESYRFNDLSSLSDTFDKDSTALATADMTGYISDIQLTEAASRTQRQAATLNLDYRLTDTTSVFLRNSFSNGRTLSGYSHAMRIRSGTGTINTLGSDFDTMDITAATMAMTVGGAPDRQGRNESWSVNPGVKHKFNNGIDVDYDAYTSRAFTKGAEGINSIGYTSPTGHYTLTSSRADEGPVLIQSGTTTANDYQNLDNYSGLTVYTADSLLTDVRNGGKFNVKVPVQFLGFPLSLRAGGSYTDWNRETHTYKKNYTLNDSSAASPNYSEFYDPTFRNEWEFSNTRMANWISPWKVRDYFATTPSLFTLSESTYKQSLFRYTRDLSETVSAGYLMGSWQVRNLNVMIGARYEHTSTEATGWKTDNNLSSSDAGYYSLITGTTSYGNFFPNVQLKYEPVKNLVLRAAYTTTISRPSLTYLIPSDSVTADSDDYDYTYVTVSNTKLKPQQSDNFDLSAEYYFPNAGLASVGVFRKEISDYIMERSGLMTEVAPELLSYYNQDDYEKPLWVTTAQNVGKATMNGFEASYRQQLKFLPSFLSKLDFYESFSYIEPDGDIEVANMKRKVANTRLTYRARKWYASVGYYWTGRYLRRSPSTTGNASDGTLVVGTDGTYVEASGRWDVGFTWQFSSAWSCSFDWRNVANEPERWERLGRPVRYFKGGTTMNLSLKATF